jgi:hypothetical protein
VISQNWGAGVCIKLFKLSGPSYAFIVKIECMLISIDVLELSNESRNENTYEMKKEGRGLTNKGLQIAK